MADREAIQADWTSWSAFALETLHLESKLLQTDRRSRAHNHIRLIAPPSNELVSGTTTGMLVRESGLYEHLGRHESVTGPNAVLDFRQREREADVDHHG